MGGTPLSAPWPLGHSHLSVELQQTQFGNHFENMSEASCFTNEKNEVQMREVGRSEPHLPQGWDPPCSRSQTASHLEQGMTEGKSDSVLTRVGSLQSTGVQDPEHESGVLQNLCG